MARTRKRTRRSRPWLPPPWARRVDWRWRDGQAAFCFPHLRHDEDAEIRELQRLADWSEENPDLLAEWMTRVDANRGPPPACLCPQCVAQLEGRA